MTHDPQQLSEHLSVRETANLLGLSLQAVYNAIWSRKLLATKDGDGWHVLRESVEGYRGRRKPAAGDMDASGDSNATE